MRAATAMAAVGLLLTGWYSVSSRAAAMADVPDRPVAATCELQWSAPDTLRTSRGETIFVERPHVAVFGERVFVTGTPAVAANAYGEVTPQVNATNAAYVQAGFLLDLATNSAQPVLPHDDNLVPVWPRAWMSDSVLRLLWQSESTASGASTGMFSGSLSVAGTLLDVHPVEPAAAIAWGAIQLSAAVARPSGDILLATSQQTTIGGVVALKRAPTGWLTQPLAVDGVAYPRLAAAPNEAFVLVAVGAGTPAGSALIAQRMSSGLELVGGRTVIHQTSGVQHWPELLQAEDSVFHVVWIEQDPTKRSADALYLATSRDAGRTWAVAAPLALPARVADLRAAVDAQGSVHAGIRMQVAPSGDLPAHAVFSEGRWRLTQLPTGGSLGLTAPVPVETKHGLTLLWNAATAAERDTRPPVMVVSSAQRVCR